MSLRRFQEELAALLLEEPARRSFARAPGRHARARGLRGQDARLLAALDAGDLGYFAARRDVDRRGFLAADLPRAYAAMDRARLVLAYVRAHPYALEDPLREAERAAAWCARTPRVPRWIAELATFEAARLALLAQPFQSPRPAARPRRAPGVRLLALEHDLAPALAGRGEARARRCLAALVRVPGDVQAGEVAAVDFHVLEAADGRRTLRQVVARAARRARLPTPAVERALRALQREGMLSPAPRTSAAGRRAPTTRRGPSSRSSGGRGPRRS